MPHGVDNEGGSRRRLEATGGPTTPGGPAKSGLLDRRGFDAEVAGSRLSIGLDGRALPIRVGVEAVLRGRSAAAPGARMPRRCNVGRMQLYLPVAEMSANIFVFLAMGGAVGFLSGMFGVGGGFLMTPLLIFAGIPAAVAVGTETAQILASSVSGALAQWRRRNIDVKMGMVLLAGGLVGSVVGVQLVGVLRRARRVRRIRVPPATSLSSASSAC